MAKATPTQSEEIEIDKGLLSIATQLLSPNFDERPAPASINMLVIHCISLPPGKYGGSEIERFFTNQLDPYEHPYFAEICQLEVSAHLLIKRTGDVVQFVNFDQRAWHAGLSCFKGEERCNDFSVGIELEGLDSDSFTDRQYSALVAVTHSLQKAYPAIIDDRIVGHEDIAPGRKTDPGQFFDWERYRREVKAQK